MFGWKARQQGRFIIVVAWRFWAKSFDDPWTRPTLLLPPTSTYKYSSPTSPLVFPPFPDQEMSRHMGRQDSSRDEISPDESSSSLSLIVLPLTARQWSFPPLSPHKSRRRKLLMLSKKPMELVSITLTNHGAQPPAAPGTSPIQLTMDSGRTILHQKPGAHIDPSVHGDHPSPPHSPALAAPSDPTCPVRRSLLIQPFLSHLFFPKKFGFAFAMFSLDHAHCIPWGDWSTVTDGLTNISLFIISLSNSL